MPTPFDYDPETLAQLQQLISGIGEEFSKSYRDRPQEPFLTIEDLAGALSGIPMEPVPLPDVSGVLERTGRAVSRFLPETTGYRTPVPTTEPGAIEREPREVGLAGVVEQDPNKAEGWISVPGTRSFMNPSRTGRWRREPGAGPTGSWADYNKAKYGAAYAAERTVGTPEYEAGGATSLRYSNLIDQILKMAKTPERYALLEKPLKDVFAAWGELGKTEAEIIASREARAEKEAQRRENAWLAQATSGGRLGAMPSEGLSTEGLKRIQQILAGSRADERLENEQARLAESERRGRMTGPSRSDIITRAQRILLESGRTVKKTPDGDLVVYQQNKPVKDGEKLLANALKEAERQLRSGAP